MPKQTIHIGHIAFQYFTMLELILEKINKTWWSDGLYLLAKSIWIYSLWLLTQCVKAWVIHSPGDPISAKPISVQWMFKEELH